MASANTEASILAPLYRPLTLQLEDWLDRLVSLAIIAKRQLASLLASEVAIPFLAQESQKERHKRKQVLRKPLSTRFDSCDWIYQL